MQPTAERVFVLPKNRQCCLLRWDGTEVIEHAMLSTGHLSQWAASIEHDLVCLYDPAVSFLEVWRGYFTDDPTRTHRFDLQHLTEPERKSATIHLKDGLLFFGTTFRDGSLPLCVDLESRSPSLDPLSDRLSNTLNAPIAPVDQYRFTNLALDDQRLLAFAQHRETAATVMFVLDVANPRTPVIESVRSYPEAMRDEDFHSIAFAGEFMVSVATGMGGYVCNFSLFARRTLKRFPPKLHMAGGRAGKYTGPGAPGDRDFWHLDGADEQIAICADRLGVGVLDTRLLHPFPPMNDDATNDEIRMRDVWTADIFPQIRWFTQERSAAVRAYFCSPSRLLVSWLDGRNQHSVKSVEISSVAPPISGQ